MEIYSLNHGWATKYIWLGLKSEKVVRDMDFIQEIKNGTISFNIDAGTTEAHCLGSSIAMTFYSQEVIDLLKEKSKNSFAEYEIVTKPKLVNNYYYIEIRSKLPRIENRNMFKEPDINKYCKKNKVEIQSILSVGSDITPLYADFSKWDGSSLFTLENSQVHFVTKELKDFLEKNKFKNLKFEKYEFLK